MVVVSILLGSDTIWIPQYLYNRLEWDEYMMICSDHLKRKGVFNMNSDVAQKQLEMFANGIFQILSLTMSTANRYVSHYQGPKRRIRRKRTRRKIREEGQALSGAQFCFEERDSIGQDKLETVLPQQPLLPF